MPVLPTTAKSTESRRLLSIAAALLGLSLAACGEPAADDAVNDQDGLFEQGNPQGAESAGADAAGIATPFMSYEEAAIFEEMSDPQLAGDELALEALEATEITEIITALTEPVFGAAKMPTLNGYVQQAIGNTVGRFGGGCVGVEKAPGLNLLESTVTFTYTNCAGPLQQASVSGTSTVDFKVDLAQRAVTATIEDNLIIHKDGQDIPLVSSRSGRLTEGGMQVEVDASYTGIAGKPRQLTGMLELTPNSAGCVTTSFGATEQVSGSGFEVSNLDLCFDGNICVGGVSLSVLGVDVSLSFDTGSLSLSRPNEAPVELPLPVSGPLCVSAL
jgi:hypothetical protein